MGRRIYISTYERKGEQVTYEALPESWKKKTFFVVKRKEASHFRKTYGKGKVLVLPKDVNGLSACRQWILENTTDNYPIFADDDITFAVRKKDMKLVKAKPKDVGKLLDLWLSWLKEDKEIAMVGVSLRFGNNRLTEDYVENTRMASFYSFNRKVLIKEKIRFDRVKLMAGLDVNLCLLEKGYRIRVACNYAHSQAKGTGSAGGCSAYRTPKLMEETVNKMTKFHPGVVNKKIKVSKTSWGGMEKTKDGKGTKRVDCNIQWKKAYKPKKKSKGIMELLK